jgi:hypothetical protein
MRVILLSGLLSAAFTSGALAAPSIPDASDCQIEETRRQIEDRRDQPPPQQGARTANAREGEVDVRPPPARRRNGKQIPDAELMAPRALL